MSLDIVRSYFRQLMDELDYEEHEESLSAENVPNPSDRGYHLDTQGSILWGPANHQGFLPEYPVLVTVFLNDGNESRLMDSSDEIIDDIVCKFLLPDTRNNGSIKDIVLNSVTRSPIAPDNDNILRIEFDFTVKLILKIE